MGGPVDLAAVRMFLVWPFARLYSPRQRTPAFLVLVALMAFGIPGCASVNVVMLSSEAFTPQTSHVEILEREPTRPYVQIAVLSVDSLWLSLDSKREKILEKAATLGADAVVFGNLHLLRQNLGNRTAGQDSPPSSLPPKDIDKPLPDGLRSSAHEDLHSADVGVMLIRGGGRGPGGGHWRGRGGWGPRPWGRFYSPYYGPRYGGYGFYGPGWWGYGPYWGGYYPYYYGGYAPYGYGAYSGYGFGDMNTVTIGTAIHYTD